MLSYDHMPEDNADLAKIEVKLPPVPLKGIPAPNSFLPQILEYLEIEGYEPDGELEFLRTARVEETIYYIWSFESGGDRCYATAAIGPKDSQCIGCNENPWNLTPEQFIMADYHNCI